jgi:uncharacterized membrane protein YjgN (DUF898 family)
MLIVFSPWRRLLQACLIAFVGCVFFYAATHSPPNSEQAVRLAWIVGILLWMVAAWMAITALRWIWQGVRIFFRGPQ